MIYLDAAATTMQKPSSVLQAVTDAMRYSASPGRGGYRAAQYADRMLFRCRTAAAELFDAQPEQVVFTMNATHGLNIAIRSLIKCGDRVVISGYEHNAVMRPLHALGAQIHAVCPPLFQDDIFLEKLEAALARPCAAVILTHISNVFGWCLPIYAAADCCRRRGVPLIIDAAQSAGVLPVQLRQSGAAFIAMPGHKGLYGPQGTGVLLCGEPGKPLLYGGTGSQSRLLEMPEELPDRHEAGTPNIPGISGLLAGIHFVREVGLQQILHHEQMLREQTERILRDFTGVQMFASEKRQNQSGVLSAVWPVDCEQVAQQLGSLGICVRAGLHCAPRAHMTAGTLESGTVRFSFSWFNRPQELGKLERAVLRLHGQ